MNNPTIDEHGIKRWFVNGRLHREDGPAVIYILNTFPQHGIEMNDNPSRYGVVRLGLTFYAINDKKFLTYHLHSRNLLNLFFTAIEYRADLLPSVWNRF